MLQDIRFKGVILASMTTTRTAPSDLAVGIERRQCRDTIVRFLRWIVFLFLPRPYSLLLMLDKFTSRQRRVRVIVSGIISCVMAALLLRE
jgi:membrane glycosyltransferase